jgi:hypothetical protein
MNIFRVILLIFLLGFIYHLSALLVEYSFNLIGIDRHGITHMACIVLSALISYLVYKRIVKCSPPEEKESDE